MGWQSQHQHAAQCNAHPVQAAQQSQMQQLGQYGANSWAMKGGQNGHMMNANYQTHNGTPMANMTNYGPNDLYNACPTGPMQKMYNTAPPVTNTTTKTQTGAGYVHLVSSSHAASGPLSVPPSNAHMLAYDAHA